MNNQRERIVAELNELFDMPVASRFGYESAVVDAITIVRRELPESQWQPIETAPLDGTKLLLAWYKKWPDGRWHFEVAPAGNLDISRQGCGSVHGDATHWMPLTEPMEASNGR